ncbi:MAG: hypothetical protein IPH94_21600 [Saprospiraceae bacterium]|nr:hypothetical protein [Saprospiraceae bacterium]
MDKLGLFNLFSLRKLVSWFFYPVSENWLPSFHPGRQNSLWHPHPLKNAMAARDKLTIENIDIDSLHIGADSLVPDPFIYQR